MSKNSLKKVRESLMLSKTELYRKAKISPMTITRIEQGKQCRMETKRKVILALGIKFQIRTRFLVIRQIHGIKFPDLFV